MLDIDIVQKMKLEVPFYLKNQLPDVYSWKEFENLINLRPFVSADRFILATNNTKVFNWPKQSWLSDINSFPPKLVNDILSKYVCYLRDCSRVNKKINQICNDIEIECGWKTDAHIYFSLKTDDIGFGKHNDGQHNLIVQVEGQSSVKVWSVDDEVIIDTVMKPGDIVFIPKDIYHQIIPKTKRLSISFPCDINIEAPEAQDRHWIEVL